MVRSALKRVKLQKQEDRDLKYMSHDALHLPVRFASG